MLSTQLTLVSHTLCPYVQRAIIALSEKNIPFERVYVDLSRKPDWFLKLSPLGKTPLLKVGERAVFESAVILEYLEETQPNPLHPATALERAEHRGWIEFSSSILSDIAGLYSAAEEKAFEAKRAALEAKFARLDFELRSGPHFLRRALFAGGRRVRAGVPLLRCLRQNFGFSNPHLQTKTCRVAVKAQRAAVNSRGGWRRLRNASLGILGGTPLVYVGNHDEWRASGMRRGLNAKLEPARPIGSSM